MSWEFSCPQCSATLEVPESMVGTQIRCGGCGALLRVPTEPYSIAERIREDAQGNVPPPPLDDSTSTAKPPTPPVREWPPPPSSASQGRGVLFWIVVVLSGLTIGSCLCCCGIFAVMPEPEWQIYASPDGWFQIEFPAQARTLPVPPAFAGPNSQCVAANLDKYGEQYRVIYWNVPPLQRLVRTDEALMQREIDRLIADLRQAQMLQPPQPVPGERHLTYELRWQDRNDVPHIARLVLAGERFYLLEVTGRFFWNEPDPERVERFFRSFRVLRLRAQDPAPLPPAGAPKKK